ncbi:MAG TPA: response regulator transcription factor [Rhodocyclaceae bacterium]|nr:response regulator transcription factor [Rhodocyclaceae bacterium]
MNAPTRVMLVDDHAVVRMGFRLLLETTGDIRVVAECARGEEALQRYANAEVDVVVLDLAMEGMGGLETLSRLVAKWPTARVLVLSAHEDTSHPRRALAAGARGYLTKRSAAEALIEAIRQVAAGKIYLEPDLAGEIAIEQVGNRGSPVERLSAREFEVFIMLARGKSVNEVAELLFLSPRTVGTHLYNIKQKLGAANAAELTLIAIRNGLIAP